jgi:hypothetical protein
MIEIGHNLGLKIPAPEANMVFSGRIRLVLKLSGGPGAPKQGPTGSRAVDLEV